LELTYLNFDNFKHSEVEESPLDYILRNLDHANMQSEDLLLRFVSILLAALLGGWLLDRLRQPPIMGYILAGVVLGNQFWGALPSKAFFELGGEIGLVLMLFFIGTEVDISRLIRDWKVPLFGTLLQTVTSVGVCLVSGLWLHWSMAQSLFFAFMISLSSTAVVLRILQDFGGTDSFIGRKSLGMLLLQDLMVIPMLIVLGMFRGEQMETNLLVRQIVGGVLVVALAVFLSSRKRLRLPVWFRMHNNHEFRIFAGLVFCLGSATITGYLGLSPALGAFLSGIVLGRFETELKLRDTLGPFKVLFVAVFFMTIGLLVDLNFLMDHLLLILFLVFLVFALNTAVATLVLRALGMSMVESLATACLLAQIGEFAFLLAASAQRFTLIDPDTYQTAVAVIALSLLLTPIWFGVSRKLMRASLGTSATIAFQITPKEGIPLQRQHLG
jgi:CPA2 family monovalent cation:H+ antiporter-2